METSEDKYDAVTHVRTTARQKRQDAIELYRESLLVSENAIQANRLILNMENVLTKKAGKGEDVGKALKQLEESRRLLNSSLITGNAAAILDVESRVEQVTLTYDRFYLESEDIRREDCRIAIDEKNHAGWMSDQFSRLIQLMRGDRKGEQPENASGAKVMHFKSCVGVCNHRHGSCNRISHR